MYRIKKVTNKTNTYQIHTESKGAFEGPKESIAWTAVQMGVLQIELDKAFREMDSKDHNVAEFGYMGTFLYSQSK